MAGNNNNNMSAGSKLILGNGFVASLLVIAIAGFTTHAVTAQKENTKAVNKLSTVLVEVDYRLKSLAKDVIDVKSDCNKNTEKIDAYKHIHQFSKFPKIKGQ